MRSFKWQGNLVLAYFLQVHAEKEEKVSEFDVIDRADAVELVNAGRRLGVFYLSEPSIGNVELVVSLGFGDPLAFFGYISRGDPQTGTQIFKLLAWPHRNRLTRRSAQPGRGQDSFHEATAHSDAILAFTAPDSLTSSISSRESGSWYASFRGLATDWNKVIPPGSEQNILDAGTLAPLPLAGV